MAVDAQRLRRMILCTGHHRPTPAHQQLSPHQEGASTAAATMLPSQQGYQSSCMLMPPPPPPPLGGPDQYTEFLALAAVDLASRGVRLQGSPRSQEMIAGYKRKRDEQSAPPTPVLGGAQQQQTIVVDRFLLNHAVKMWEALAKQRQRHMRLITSAAEDRAAKRLKVKDEEMKCIRGMNWELHGRIRNLQMQARMWQDLAASNQAAANVLRANLQRALDAQAVRGRGVRDVDDAGSCCWGEDHEEFCGDDDEYEVSKPVAMASVGSCKGCRQGDAVVLLLPCRHLCVCPSCANTVRACPACGCTRTGTICVNFS